jgi:ABC-2 type transport system permease protein
MTPVLRTLAEWNPVSSLVSALRMLYGNPGVVTTDVALPLQHPIQSSLVWSTAILVVATAAAVRRYSRITR